MPFFNCTSLFCWAQKHIERIPIEQKDLPKGMAYFGKIKDGFRWIDRTGNHITLICETGEFPSKHEQYEDFRDAELFAYDFINNGSKQSWKLHDYVRNCPVDITASFIRKAFQLTDLNKDGVGEIWVMYRTSCHGDVSPSEMKIIMHEGGQKFAMRGRSKVKYSETGYDGGEYEFDNAFIQGPNEFRAFAEKLWSEYVNENWE